MGGKPFTICIQVSDGKSFVQQLVISQVGNQGSYGNKTLFCGVDVRGLAFVSVVDFSCYGIEDAPLALFADESVQIIPPSLAAEEKFRLAPLKGFGEIDIVEEGVSGF